MEVHHHPHTERKKWTHYFWEFFMLFLAVTLGFFVENQREHYIEHQRERQYIRSLIEDLKVDDQSLDKQNAVITRQLLMMDSLIVILNDPALVAERSDQLYYLGRVSPRYGTLSVNNRTFEQLKNSGNFRLIRNLSISDKIMAYYDRLQRIRQLEAIYDSQFTEYQRVAAKIFDPIVFRDLEQNDGSIARTNTKHALRTNDPELLKELAVFSIYMNGTRRGLLSSQKELKKAAGELINFLQEEYQLK